MAIERLYSNKELANEAAREAGMRPHVYRKRSRGVLTYQDQQRIAMMNEIAAVLREMSDAEEAEKAKAAPKPFEDLDMFEEAGGEV